VEAGTSQDITDMKKVKLEIRPEDCAAYIAALDMAIVLCMQKISHINAGDFLSQLRTELMEEYVDHE
jgi:hypothetical protein